MTRWLAAAAIAAACGAASGVAPRAAVPEPAAAIGFDQRVGERLPLDLTFRDEEGTPVHLGDFFGHAPVVLSLVYFRCPMLCSLVLDGEARALSGLAIAPGRDFTLVSVSIDPDDTPGAGARARSKYAARLGHAWHFLTGDAASIAALSRAAGFRYRRNEATGGFDHAAGIVVVTPDGVLSRYLYGINFRERDLRLALVEASHGRLGSVADEILLYCSHYDPVAGRYGLVIMRILRLFGAACALALAFVIAVLVRRERRAGRIEAEPARAGGAP